MTVFKRHNPGHYMHIICLNYYVILISLHHAGAVKRASEGDNNINNNIIFIIGPSWPGNWIIYLKDRSFLESNTRDLLKYKTSQVTKLAGEAAAHTASTVVYTTYVYYPTY